MRSFRSRISAIPVLGVIAGDLSAKNAPGDLGRNQHRLYGHISLHGQIGVKGVPLLRGLSEPAVDGCEPGTPDWAAIGMAARQLSGTTASLCRMRICPPHRAAHTRVADDQAFQDGGARRANRKSQQTEQRVSYRLSVRGLDSLAPTGE